MLRYVPNRFNNVEGISARISFSNELFFSKVLPQILPFDFGDGPIDALDMAVVNCAVNKGDTPIDIYWTFNGHKITTNNGITISKSGPRLQVLNIESVRGRHRGNYTCIASNSAGSVQHTAELNVNGS